MVWLQMIGLVTRFIVDQPVVKACSLVVADQKLGMHIFPANNSDMALISVYGHSKAKGLVLSGKRKLGTC